MSLFRKLFGKKSDPAPALPSGKTPLVALASTPSSVDPSNDPDMVRIHDAYGREMFITKAQWRDSVLLGQIKKVWDQPNELAPVIVQAISDGFAADVIKAATHLAAIDGNPERGHVLLSSTHLQLKRYDDAEEALVRYFKRYGETGSTLTNLAKVHSGRGDHTRALETLWRGLALDPNQENGLGWYELIHREKSGPAASLEAYRRVAALPGAWRARLWLARDRLENRDLTAALAFYAEALACAPRPIPADFLGQLSGDLGNHAHLPELLRLTAPHYDIALHGLPVGSNLLKAYLDLGQIDAARAMLDRLYAQQRPDWKQNLSFWDLEIAKATASTADAPEPSKLEITLLTVEGPVWLPPDSPAADLFPAKSEDAPMIAFLGGSAELDPGTPTSRPQSADGPGRLSRALPLYLAEQVEFGTAALSRTLVAWIVKPTPGFILGGVPWDDATASRHARQAAADDPADYLVVSHLLCRTEPWTIELRLVRTIDATCLATASTPCLPSDPGKALPELTRTLLALLAEHADLPTSAQPASGLSSDPSSGYLLRLEQLLAIGTAAMGRAGGALHGERDMLEGQLRLCLDQPESVSIRLIFAHALRGMRKVRPGILPEFRARVELLQREKPLPEPAQSVTGRILAEAFAE